MLEKLLISALALSVLIATLVAGAPDFGVYETATGLTTTVLESGIVLVLLTALGVAWLD